MEIIVLARTPLQFILFPPLTDMLQSRLEIYKIYYLYGIVSIVKFHNSSRLKCFKQSVTFLLLHKRQLFDKILIFPILDPVNLNNPLFHSVSFHLGNLTITSVVLHRFKDVCSDLFGIFILYIFRIKLLDVCYSYCNCYVLVYK